MQTLTISEIFSQLAFYQAEYLTILNDPTQYLTPVQQASLDVWPFNRAELCLGELLQLWFGEKWVIQPASQLFDADPVLKRHLPKQQDLYLYDIHGNILTGKYEAWAWSLSQQKPVAVELESVVAYYSFYKSLTAPQAA
jgi:hypothetical protein